MRQGRANGGGHRTSQNVTREDGEWGKWTGKRMAAVPIQFDRPAAAV